MTDATREEQFDEARFAQLNILQNAKTGYPDIDSVTQELMAALTAVDTVVGAGAGPVYGTLIHSRFAAAVKARNIPGVSVEQSFDLGGLVRYGLDGSIRTDVILQNLDGGVIAVWDVKTGGAKLSGARVQAIRQALDVDNSVPVIELHIKREVTIKMVTLSRPSLSTHSVFYAMLSKH